MRNALKQMPIGIDNFKELITKNGYFVDKSLLIKEIMNSLSKVILFTRPRRFGKTLNFSMLKCFLEIPECRKYDNEDQDYSYLFEGLTICEDKDFIKRNLGKYPVINFSFKKIKANGWADAEYFFKEEIAREYKRHRYILETNILLDFEKQQYKRLMSKEAQIHEYTSAIIDLSSYLNSYFNKKAIVLIDEYDTPLHYAKLNGYYDEMLNFIRALMVDGLKGNDHIEKGIVTGILKISQESIFSAFNNPKIATVTSTYCAGSFGFTEGEVEDMAGYYGMEEYMETIREWYDGYIFGGDTLIYNPWSVISFFDSEDRIPKAFWVNTGDTGLIKKCIQLDKVRGKEHIERLYSGETIEMEVEQNIIYEEVFNNVDKALSYLFHAGYLKARRVEGKTDTYSLSIPNKELAQIYKSILKNWFAIDRNIDNVNTRLIESLLKEDMEDFGIYLQDILLSSSSYFDAAGSSISHSPIGKEKEKYESFYHGLILGIMVSIPDDYYVQSNREYGLGRPDIVILPKDKNQNAYILELKNEYTSSKKTEDDAAKEALQQIKDKKYDEGVKNTGIHEVVKIGLGFKGKELKICV